jgi:hypothetical protein
MAVRLPDWWCYPERCQNGHEWGPGLITVSWVLCDCPPAPAARERAGGGPAGHMAVFCNAAPKCRSVWYRPRHEPTELGVCRAHLCQIAARDSRMRRVGRNRAVLLSDDA